MAKIGIGIVTATIIVMLTVSPRVTAAADAPLLLLDVMVNGFPTGKIGEFVQRDSALLVRPSELYDIGLRVPDSVQVTPDNLVSLSNIPGLTWHLDQATQTLYVTASSDLLLPTLLQARSTLDGKIPVETGTGATLNYDIVGSHAGTETLVSGIFDLRGFSPYGVLSSGLLVYRGPGSNGVPGPYTPVRLDSTYTFSDPVAMRRYRAGDFINGGLVWTRPVRLAGAQVESDFALRPDLVTMPLPLVSGTVAVPSTVDVLVNGDRVFSSQVQPGPFQIPQLPVVSGASTISLAVTNALGRQVVESLPFYSGAGLLAPDLQTFAAEVGAVRHNYGILSNDYGDLAASATWRRGLSSAFTAEAHAETTLRLVMAGGGGSVNVANLGVLNFSAASSTGSGHTGVQVSVGASRIAQPWSFGASATMASRGFGDIAATNGDPVPTLQLNGSIGLSLRELGSLGVAYTGVDRPAVAMQNNIPHPPLLGGPIFLQPAQHAHVISASYSVQIRNVSVYATGFHDLANNHGTGVLVGLSIPLGGRGAASIGAGGGSDGGYRQFQANQSAAATGEWGYQIYGADGRQSHQFGEVQYESPWALLSAGVDHSGGQAAFRLEGQGALSYVAGGLFASNTINDSFAVVDTNGVANIRVLREHREIGRTDDHGQLFVPDLRSFDINHLEIDPTDVPADATFPSPTRDVRPQDRSGIVVKFPIRISHGALLRLIDEAGGPVPVGSTASLKATGVNLPVGYDGETYAENLESHNELAVTKSDGRRCIVTFDYRPVSGDIPRIGPLTCREERP